MVSLTAVEMCSLADIAAKFKLDFDDAYQYSASVKNGLTIVSFDADFDRTSEGRLLPANVV
jgi:predicted nucleic acid-binding protein